MAELFEDIEEEDKVLHLNPKKQLQSIAVEDVGVNGPMIIGKAPLPLSLRGVFWLTDQEDSSCLMSFGGPNGDGGICSSGSLDDDGSYKVRVLGDRVWSYGCECDEGPVELIYHFVFDDVEEPTHADIHPMGNRVGLKQDVNDCGQASPLAMMFMSNAQHSMDLLDDDSEFPNSVVWKRKSGTCWLPLYTYKLVQILDEDGQKIEPAFTKFVTYMKEGGGKDSEGFTYYHGDQ